MRIRYAVARRPISGGRLQHEPPRRAHREGDQGDAEASDHAALPRRPPANLPRLDSLRPPMFPAARHQRSGGWGSGYVDPVTILVTSATLKGLSGPELGSL